MSPRRSIVLRGNLCRITCTEEIGNIPRWLFNLNFQPVPFKSKAKQTDNCYASKLALTSKFVFISSDTSETMCNRADIDIVFVRKLLSVWENDLHGDDVDHPHDWLSWPCSATYKAPKVLKNCIHTFTSYCFIHKMAQNHLIIYRVAFVKPGDNTIGRVHQSFWLGRP